MIPHPLHQVCEWLDGQLLRGEPEALVTGASINTQDLAPGQLFFALQGNRTHGLEFAQEALRRGARAVVTDAIGTSRVDGPTIEVADPRAALGKLAAAVRGHQERTLPAVAITGSVGKTTTCRYVRELLDGMLRVHCPPASFNNDLGVPLTILNAPADCQLLVCEIGASGPGEVLRLGRWVRPQAACVTAVGPAHLEGFGSLEVIELEKLSILEALQPTGVGCAPTSLVARHNERFADFPAPVFGFGDGGQLHIQRRAQGGQLALHWRQVGQVLPFDWEPPFPHSVSNLEAALAICIGLGLPVEEMIERIPQLTLPPLRGENQNHGGVDFLLDCYNSNPLSLDSAIERLEQERVPGRKVCVVGTMEELGEEEQEWHERLGRRLGSSGIDSVYVFGRGGEWYRSGLREVGADGTQLDDDDESARTLAEQLAPGDRVLFKASRTAALERFAAQVASFLGT